MAPSPVSGNITLLVNVSSRSKIFRPKNRTSSQMLNDSNAAMPNTQTATPLMMVAPTRDSGVRSSTSSTVGSSSEIADVSAAKVSSRKNIKPRSVPPAILPNATGRLTKIRPGPSLGLMPLAKTMGKMAIPASRAMMVSSTITVRAVLSRLTSSPR